MLDITSKTFHRTFILLNFENVSENILPIGADLLEFTFIAEFSILEASFAGKMDIKSNWVLTST